MVCPPTIWLRELAQAVPGLHLGAQTMHCEERGPFTGETSPLMLDGIATFVILGHSERRQYDGETDESVGRKVATAVAHGLRPIAAVGERAEERRAGQTEAVVERQLRAALAWIGVKLRLSSPTIRCGYRHGIPPRLLQQPWRAHPRHLRELDRRVRRIRSRLRQRDRLNSAEFLSSRHRRRAGRWRSRMPTSSPPSPRASVAAGR